MVGWEMITEVGGYGVVGVVLYDGDRAWLLNELKSADMLCWVDGDSGRSVLHQGTTLTLCQTFLFRAAKLFFRPCTVHAQSAASLVAEQ